MISSDALLKIFRSSNLSCIVLLPDAPRFTIAEVTNAYLENTGMPAEIIGKSVFEIFADDNNTDCINFLLKQSLNKVITTKTSHKINARKPAVNLNTEEKKEQKYWDIESAPVLTDQSEIQYIVQTITDITEKVEAENNLKNSEEKYKMLFQLAPIPKWFYDAESFKILDVNQSAIDQYGYNHEEFLSMTMEDFRPRKDAGREGSVHFGVFLHRKKDGTEFNVEVSGHKFRYNEKDCIMVTSVDVDQRENAIQQLREEEAKLLTAQKIAKLGYWQITLDKNKLYWSDEVYTIWGVSKDSFHVDLKSFYATVYPDDRDELSKAQSIALADGKELDFEHRIILPDGSVKWVHERAKLAKDKNGKPTIFEGSVQDITSGKLLELSLEESNQRYRYASKATSDAIWDWNLETEIIFWGENFELIFGYNLPDFQSSSDFWYEHIHPEDRENMATSIKNAMAGVDLHWSNEYRFLKADNSYANIYDKGFFIRNNNGKVIRMVGAMQDITKRKTVEGGLLQFKMIIENSQNAVRISDQSGNIIYVNPAFTNLLGYNLGMLKKSGGIQVIYANKNVALEVADALNKGKNWNGEVDLVTLGGNVISTQLNAGPVYNDKGNLFAVYAIHTNISERIKGEQKLQEAYNERNNILESIGDVFFAVDRNWTVTYWNRMAENILRKPKEEILGKNLWKEYDFGKDPIYFNNFQKALKDNTARYFEVTIERSNTSFEVSVFPSFNGLSIYMKDVTEQNEYEASLKRLNDDLEKMNKELVASNTELEHFAYIASHDLQEPLRMITSFLSQIEKKYGNLIDAKGKQYIHFAVDGAKRMRQIILDLLEFSRVGRMQTHNRERVDLNGLINGILLFFQKQIEETGAIIEVECLPVIETYKTSVEQIFQNLIGNALKYKKETEAPRITISSTENPTHWLFSVADNGIGIDPEYHNRIFIIFQRLHNKDEYSGTGIGLAIVKKIVDNLGGNIWLESKEGVGSTFFFSIEK